MATILELFKSQQTKLYGNLDNVRIESRGLINPPRGAALLASSPNKLADLIGGQIGGAIGGTANRPDDTIFTNDSFLGKPISLFKTPETLRNAIEADTPYYVKQSPSPESIVNKIKQGSSSPIGVATNIGFNLIKGLKDRNPTRDNPYGAKYSTTVAGKTINETKTFSNFYQENVTAKNKHTGKLEWVGGSIKKRDDNKILKGKSFDIINYDIISSLSDKTDFEINDYTDFKTKNTLNVPFVFIQMYDKPTQNILLPGTISGISEDINPLITDFRYVGSPFNVYKYGGVSRELKFELKMYYVDTPTKLSMQRNLDKLRKLVFPDESISVNTYPNNGGYSPMLYNPNLVYLTINGLYSKLFGIIDNLSISIDDATPWESVDITNPLVEPGNSAATPYPSVINVQIGMKIIEKPKIVEQKYVYNFTGLSAKTATEVSVQSITQQGVNGGGFEFDSNKAAAEGRYEDIKKETERQAALEKYEREQKK
jgi:hypothetical protein